MERFLAKAHKRYWVAKPRPRPAFFPLPRGRELLLHETIESGLTDSQRWKLFRKLHASKPGEWMPIPTLKFRPLSRFIAGLHRYGLVEAREHEKGVAIQWHERARTDEHLNRLLSERLTGRKKTRIAERVAEQEEQRRLSGMNFFRERGIEEALHEHNLPPAELNALLVAVGRRYSDQAFNLVTLQRNTERLLRLPHEERAELLAQPQAAFLFLGGVEARRALERAAGDAARQAGETQRQRTPEPATESRFRARFPQLDDLLSKLSADSRAPLESFLSKGDRQFFRSQWSRQRRMVLALAEMAARISPHELRLTPETLKRLAELPPNSRLRAEPVLVAVLQTQRIPENEAAEMVRAAVKVRPGEHVSETFQRQLFRAAARVMAEDRVARPGMSRLLNVGRLLLLMNKYGVARVSQDEINSVLGGGYSWATTLVNRFKTLLNPIPPLARAPETRPTPIRERPLPPRELSAERLKGTPMESGIPRVEFLRRLSVRRGEPLFSPEQITTIRARPMRSPQQVFNILERAGFKVDRGLGFLSSPANPVALETARKFAFEVLAGHRKLRERPG